MKRDIEAVAANVRTQRGKANRAAALAASKAAQQAAKRDNEAHLQRELLERGYKPRSEV